jgi:monoamine oxidase
VNHDVIGLGAGLAGLSCARDLARGGADVLVVEARGRVGGRVEQTALSDGRLVQLGGEVVGPFHTAYAGLVAELGLTLVPSFPQLPGAQTWVLAGQTVVGDDYPWMSDADRASYERRRRRSPRWPRLSTRTTRGRTRTRQRWTGCRSATGCDRSEPRPTWCGRATCSCSRSRPSRWSARRCCRTCARRR